MFVFKNNWPKFYVTFSRNKTLFVDYIRPRLQYVDKTFANENYLRQVESEGKKKFNPNLTL